MSVRTLSQNKYTAAKYNKTNATLPNGSVSFDGNGDYLSVGANDAFAFGTSDFCIEFFVYSQSTSTQLFIYSDGPAQRYSVALGMRSGGLWWLFGNGSSWVFERDVAGAAPGQNVWTHIAVTRSGTTARLFKNGTLVDNLTNSTDLVQGTTWQLGGNTGNSLWLTGKMSNIRFVKGAAVYTAAFTPPTSRLAAISGTSLLTAQHPDQIIDSSTNAFTVTANGNAAASSTNPF